MVSKKKQFISSKTKKLKKAGLNIIPGLAQTLAKSPSQFSENFSPIFLEKGKGAIVTDYENMKHDWSKTPIICLNYC